MIIAVSFVVKQVFNYGETTALGSMNFYNEVCYSGGVYDKTTGLYYLNARYYNPEVGSFLTQDTYRGENSKTDTLNYYVYCAGNPISYTDPTGHWLWGVIGAAMGAYDGYKYAKKHKLKGAKKAAAIAGGAALGAVDPIKIVSSARKVVKAVKYVRRARSVYKKAKVVRRSLKKAKVVKRVTKKLVRKAKPKKSKRTVKKVTRKLKKCTSKGNCFVAGTKIHTKDGFKNIEAMKAGDYVWSENVVTHDKELKKVKKIFVREKDSIVRLRINGEVIETTDEHPFYVEGVGFIPAGELELGDEVRLEDGNTAKLEEKTRIQLKNPIKVYNFEVDDFHTYYVSEQKVLVHNQCVVVRRVKRVDSYKRCQKIKR